MLKNLSQDRKNTVDGDYTGQNFADAIRGILRVEVEVVKQNEHHTFSISFSFTSIVTLQILQFRIQKNP